MIIRDQFFQKKLIRIGSKFHLEKSIKNFRTKFAQARAFLIQN